MSIHKRAENKLLIINGWPLLRNKLDWARWCISEYAKPSRFGPEPRSYPCLAETKLSADEDSIPVYHTLESVARMFAALKAGTMEAGIGPLFIPLKAEFFDQFEAGTKDTEYRLSGPRWNAVTCRVGRRVILSRGYGKKRRLFGAIASFRYDRNPEQLPGWTKCYGRNGGIAACIKIKLDQSHV